MFDTLSTENKSEAKFEENEEFEKTEPVFASSEKTIEENVLLENNLDINENEEFSAEEETSEIDEEFNQETEEELLDIPTFLRRQAN